MDLADHLTASTQEIVSAWCALVENDNVLKAAWQAPQTRTLGRVPQIIEALTQSLRAQSRRAPSVPTLSGQMGRVLQGVRRADLDAASEHGLERLRQGYKLGEVARELGHLHLCVADEIGAYRQSRPDFSPAVLQLAHRQLALLINVGVEQGLEHFANRREADSKTRDLEDALAEIRETERVRGRALRATSHDVRSSLAVVESTAAMLAQVTEESMRADLGALMQRGVESLKRILSDMTQLARLEADQETTRVEAFDVSLLLRELCDASQPLAHHHQLRLEASGPMPFFVEGDLVKTQRIAQNLLFNALKYTSDGGVLIQWKLTSTSEWMLSVADTGSGIARQIVESFMNPENETPNFETPNLEVPKTETAHAHGAVPLQSRQAQATSLPWNRPQANEAPSAEHEADFLYRLQPGEGIGLAIVKRLCVLLNARLEVETGANGSTFRVFFPLHYEQ